MGKKKLLFSREFADNALSARVCEEVSREAWVCV